MMFWPLHNVKRTVRASLFVAGVVITFSNVLSSAQAAETSAEVVAQLDTMMREQVVPNLTITVKQNDQAITESSHANVPDQTPIVVDTIKYIGLNSTADQPNVLVNFVGTHALPHTIMTVRFATDNIVRSTVVDEEGQWEINVPLDTLYYPSQSAYLMASQGQIASQAYVVGQFDIRRSESLSQDTWMFLLSALIAIVTLLLAVTIQVRHNMKPQPGMLY